MTRRQPGAPPEITLRADRADKVVTQVRSYEVITALFGGGVEPASPDPITVVRASEVRGQLRFWWRATRGGQFRGDLNALRAAEEAIWGGPAREEQGKSVGGQSQVQVVITDWRSGTPDIPFEIKNKRPQPRQNSVVPAYAAFPLQPERAAIEARTPIKPVLTGVRFTLAISFPRQYEEDVAAALWAWETFGGIGARTRRGFGALRLLSVDGQAPRDLPPADRKRFSEWLNTKLKHHITGEAWPADVPHLVRGLRFVALPGSNAFDIWKDLIGELQKFRQQRQAKGHTSNKYGHSDWPEPNTIRSFFRQPPRGPYAQRMIRAFPRAALGLPIVFHMYHDPGLDATLEGPDAKRSRLASPLILKPVACSDGKTIGLAAILEGVRPPQSVVLKRGTSEQKPVEVEVSEAEAQRIPPLDGNPDVLQAFLDRLRKDSTSSGNRSRR
ncbi:type III-B CRISPR module RAMP protein Cmr1 [Kallotenue papyrolyticum]|uniref:type III-B CRISPR module RAMP protein Cmr1 n=1 Tax=Kallotenue papyrolyticum TaxID=1325125 RepID=UPI0004924379|nr:type III-B CRISPR module RAMP protein Cmr1 [Kallotenue papyrolyticum]